VPGRQPPNKLDIAITSLRVCWKLCGGRIEQTVYALQHDVVDKPSFLSSLDIFYTRRAKH